MAAPELLNFKQNIIERKMAEAALLLFCLTLFVLVTTSTRLYSQDGPPLIQLAVTVPNSNLSPDLPMLLVQELPYCELGYGACGGRCSAEEGKKHWNCPLTHCRVIMKARAAPARRRICASRKRKNQRPVNNFISFVRPSGQSIRELRFQLRVDKKGNMNSSSSYVIAVAASIFILAMGDLSAAQVAFCPAKSCSQARANCLKLCHTFCSHCDDNSYHCHHCDVAFDRCIETGNFYGNFCHLQGLDS